MTELSASGNGPASDSPASVTPPGSMALPLLFVGDDVVLPGMVVPLQLDGERQAAVDAARSAAADDATPQVLLVPRVDGRYGAVGAVGEIVQVGRTPGGEPAAVVRATGRARIGTGVNGPGAALWVEAEPIAQPKATEHERGVARDVRSVIISILQERGSWQVVDTVSRMNDPYELADAAGYASWLEPEQKVQLLETTDLIDRLELVGGWARDHLAELEVAGRIREDVRESMDKTQREFLLRQQLAAIRKELGEDEPEGASDYRSRVEAAVLPDAVREAAMREANKLERTSEQSPEAGWIRTWLDTVLELPWDERTVDSIDITAARAVLDADHQGLDDVKDRIVEHLAVRARRAERGLVSIGGRGSGAVLALVGPPGRRQDVAR